MPKILKPALFDILTGLVLFALVNVFSTFVYFDYLTCGVLIAILFTLAGWLRGNNRALPFTLRLLLINLATLTACFYVPLPVKLFLPIPFIALLASGMGLYLRSKSPQWGKGKPALLAVLSLVVICGLTYLFYPNYISHQSSQEMHQPAGEFGFVSFAGDSVKSTDVNGQVVLLDFWDSSCGPCVAGMPALEKLYAKYKDHPKVKIYCINVGWKPMEKEQEFIIQRGYDLPWMYDAKSVCENKMGFGGAGFMILLDKQHNIRLLHNGYDRAENLVGYMSRHIEKLLAES